MSSITLVSLPLSPFLRSFPLLAASFSHHSRRASTAPRGRDDGKLTVAVPPPKGAPETSLEDSALRPLPYHVHRTASQKLPVYQQAKQGGNLHQTRVRKIDGDLQALRDDLRRALGLQEEHIVINQLTRHIIIKGWRKADVSTFLEQLRF